MFSEKSPSRYPRTQDDFIRCLILSDQQSTIERFSISYNVRPRKAADSYILASIVYYRNIYRLIDCLQH